MKPTEADRPDTAYEHVIRVTWGDCDPAKIAYTARIPWFALDAINGWWEHNLGGDGWFQMELDRNMGTPFVHMSLDFFAPITPRYRLVCLVWPTRLGDTSVEFRVDGFQDGTLCFSGRFVNVFTIADQFRKSPPPDAVRKIVQARLPATIRPTEPDGDT